MGLAVIYQAIVDCCERVGPPMKCTWADRGKKNGQDAYSAREFLSKRNTSLDFWCSVAGESPDRVITRYWTQMYKTRRRNGKAH